MRLPFSVTLGCCGQLLCRELARWCHYFAARVFHLRDWLACARREWNASGIVEQHLIVRSIARDVDMKFCHFVYLRSEMYRLIGREK